MSKSSTDTQKKEHTHIWKYIGAGYERVCESPFEMLVKGCGKREIKDESGWPS